MDEKKQENIQSSDPKELNVPEENQNHNHKDKVTPAAASDGVEHEQSMSAEKSASPSSASGQKSGINKKVLGAAAVVVAAVVGGAVYMTQQSQTGGMWSSGNSASRTAPLSDQSEPISNVSAPEAPQGSVQAETNQVQTDSANNAAVTADTESAPSAVTAQDGTLVQSATEETAAVEESTTQQAKSTDSEEITLAESTQNAAHSGAATADSSVTEAEQVHAGADAGNESETAGVVKAQLDLQTEQINQLKTELQQIQTQYAELLEQRLNRADVDVSLFVVNDVSRLVQSADNELSIAGNLPNAIRALEMAQQTIRRANSPVLAGLAGAISSDIVMLKSAPVMNEDTLFKEVGKLIELLDQAPLISPDRVDHLSTVLPVHTNALPGESDGQATASQDLSWHEKAWEEIKSWPSQAMGLLKSDLGGLVRVEKLDDPTVALISAGQAAALKNNLKLDLRFAQQGLLNAQQGIWTSSLESVQAALLKYYNQDAPETRQALEQTRTLLAIPVRPQLPQITHSVKAIEETRSQIINLGKPQE